jgi:transposase
MVKSKTEQAAALVFRMRDLLVGQRTQAINALRDHLTEYGQVVAKGPRHVPELIALIEDRSSALPEPARLILLLLIEMLRTLAEKIAVLDIEIGRRAKADKDARRLMIVPHWMV